MRSEYRLKETPLALGASGATKRQEPPAHTELDGALWQKAAATRELVWLPEDPFWR